MNNLNTSFIEKNSTVIVGLSGGPDSVCLLHQLWAVKKTLNIKIIAVHLDHEWNETSKIAAQLCATICKQLNVPLVLKKSSELNFDPKWNGSKEEQGRKIRRHLFEKTAKQHKSSTIALAHHRQDQHETFFIRLFRGSSITGLTGMSPQEGLYVKPLLNCDKEEILDYLDSNLLEYFNDPSNSSDDFLRNRIRQQLIPALKKCDDRFEQSLDSTMQQLTDAKNFIEAQANEALKKITTAFGLAIEPFLQLHQTLQQQILIKLLIEQQQSFVPSQKMLKEIVRFLQNNKSNQHQINPAIFVQKEKNCFLILQNKKNKKTL